MDSAEEVRQFDLVQRRSDRGCCRYRVGVAGRMATQPRRLSQGIPDFTLGHFPCKLFHFQYSIFLL